MSKNRKEALIASETSFIFLCLLLVLASPLAKAEASDLKVFQPGEVIRSADINSNFRVLDEALANLAAGAAATNEGAVNVVSYECTGSDDLQAVVDGMQSNVREIKISGSCSTDGIVVPRGSHLVINLNSSDQLLVKSIDAFYDAHIQISGGTVTLGKLLVGKSSYAELGVEGELLLDARSDNSSYAFIVSEKSAARIQISGCAGFDSKSGLGGYAWGGSRLEIEFVGDMGGCFGTDGADMRSVFFGDTVSYIRVEDSLASVSNSAFYARENGVLAHISELENRNRNFYKAWQGGHADIKNACGIVELRAATAAWDIPLTCAPESSYLGIVVNSHIQASGKLRTVLYDRSSSLYSFSAASPLDLSEAAFTLWEGDSLLPE